MRTGQMHETLLPKWLALPIFASDPLSSVAYATEEALVVLVGAAGLGVIVLANLRGVRESGLLFALPTYAFIAAIVSLDAIGLVQYATGHLHRAVVPHALPAGAGAVGVFILLRAFSSGSTALTGVEAIANGVNAFRQPQGKNAAKTLGALGVMAIVMFLGVSFLAIHVHAQPSATGSVVSQIARAVFQPGSVGGFMYYAVQATTLLILIL